MPHNLFQEGAERTNPLSQDKMMNDESQPVVTIDLHGDDGVTPAALLKKESSGVEIEIDASSVSSSTSTISSDDDSSSSDDDSSIDSDFSDWDEGLGDIEERIQVVGSTPALAAMIFGDRNDNRKGGGRTNNHNKSRGESDVQSLASFRSNDGSVLSSFNHSTKSFEMRRCESDVVFQAADYTSVASQDDFTSDGGVHLTVDGIPVIKPDDYLHQLLTEQGVTVSPSYEALTLDDDKNDSDKFFLQMRPENIAAYNQDIATAVRHGNLKVVQQHHEEGKNLQCCNKFHESIIHTICRRGYDKLLKYVIDEVQLSIRVRCDYGRTPLHDACWTDKPNFELVRLILQTCPDLLYIKDSRGYTPLNYVGKSLWSEWNTFLKDHQDLLAPKFLA